ncbi:diphosphomevalonate decarboxylase [Limosilactobacillus sp.]|jgi:diphosphomevalonate decarboxylase|uniref:diphosphomevalonate decarboxylase n=1 Tax=Limosilactobacillus sp. TaxID=2773925 RepID=UPI0025B9A2AA|nr:diphosphomevalonate decarboxylase [Limosilactobacillus sp.]MCH3922945.1 diphosphomevalonate decarboxylase [Limosilactobacillus sp.]MCH3927628.1 diphosphomevalonate decarboxylase [Limosilactobacillus sp.]
MATAKAHTNIALVKYWGKKDQELIIPQTDSLSLTLNEFYTTTRVNFDPNLAADQVTINHELLSPAAAKRTSAFLDLVRQRSGRQQFARVDSINHVPTAAGLASSASAFAALAGAASAAAGLSLDRRELSRLARRGSGSATRSIFGGLVEWHRGHDDSTSFAEPIMEKLDFGLEMLAIMINTKKKKVTSRQGMQASVTTSPYYASWREVVATDMQAMKDAINRRDIPAIGHIAEENALRMHALTLSADPGYTYFNSATLTAIQTVRALRENGIDCYFTMDAGPNVKVIYDRQDRDRVISGLTQTFDRDQLVVSPAGPGIQIWNEDNNQALL